jgi:hypothetical protein
MHELIVVDLDPPIPISIELAKRFTELLDDNASTDESVERDTRRRSTTDSSLISFSIYPQERGFPLS